MATSGELEWFLSYGTREPLLTADEEITLATQIAAGRRIREEVAASPRDLTPKERHTIRKEIRRVNSSFCPTRACWSIWPASTGAAGLST